MEVDTQLFTKLKELREKYDLDIDKEMVWGWEKALRTAIIREDLKKHAAIKSLIKNLDKTVQEITFSLAWDSELNKQENSLQRRDMFISRKCFQWLLSFFSDSKKQIDNIEKRVEEEIKG